MSSSSSAFTHNIVASLNDLLTFCVKQVDTAHVTSRPSDPRAVPALAAAGLLFGLTIPLTKVALGWLDAATLAAVRFALAAPLLAVIAGRRAVRDALDARVVVSGAAGYGALVLLQNLGVGRTSVTHAALLAGSVPVLVALVVAARGTSLARRTWAGLGLAVAGAALVAGGGGRPSLAGDALVLASAVLGAGFVAAQPRLLRGRVPVAVAAVQLAGAAILTLPLALFDGVPARPTGSASLLATAGLVVAGSVLPCALYSFGQSHVHPATAGAFVNLEPVVGAAAGLVMGGGALALSHVAGLAVVAAGVLLVLAAPAPVDRPAQPRWRRQEIEVASATIGR
jgi:drug/metabolite transporter (DMT)-like permease